MAMRCRVGQTGRSCTVLRTPVRASESGQAAELRGAWVEVRGPSHARPLVRSRRESEVWRVACDSFEDAVEVGAGEGPGVARLVS